MQRIAQWDGNALPDSILIAHLRFSPKPFGLCEFFCTFCGKPHTAYSAVGSTWSQYDQISAKERPQIMSKSRSIHYKIIRQLIHSWRLMATMGQFR